MVNDDPPESLPVGPLPQYLLQRHGHHESGRLYRLALLGRLIRRARNIPVPRVELLHRVNPEGPRSSPQARPFIRNVRIVVGHGCGMISGWIRWQRWRQRQEGWLSRDHQHHIGERNRSPTGHRPGSGMGLRRRTPRRSSGGLPAGAPSIRMPVRRHTFKAHRTDGNAMASQGMASQAYNPTSRLSGPAAKRGNPGSANRDRKTTCTWPMRAILNTAKIPSMVMEAPASSIASRAAPSSKVSSNSR